MIDNSRRAGFGYDVRTEVFGAKGALFVGYSRDTPMLHLTPNGVSSDHIHWFLERFDQAYIDELRDFVDAIVDDRPVAGHRRRRSRRDGARLRLRGIAS